jgi:hypothetical protein
MSDIFISYAREDRPRAETLARVLEENGWSVWWDRSIPAGKSFPQVIQEEMAKARCVLVLWSAFSVAKEWVIEEALEAKKRGTLVPIQIDQVEPPWGFRLLQARDLVGWNGTATAPSFQSLRTDIYAMVQSNATENPPEFDTGQLVGRWLYCETRGSVRNTGTVLLHSDFKFRVVDGMGLALTRGIWEFSPSTKTLHLRDQDPHAASLGMGFHGELTPTGEPLNRFLGTVYWPGGASWSWELTREQR